MSHAGGRRMDVKHFGLSRRPFPNVLDSRCWYPAPGHETTIKRLAEAVSDGEGLILLSGESGTGKTLLCRRLLGRLSDFNQVYLTNSHLADVASLLQAVLYDLSLSYEGKREQELRLALTDFLLEEFATGRRTLLVIDEAQHLSFHLLEEVRLWGNLEADGSRALQVILVADPQIMEIVSRPGATAVSRRISTRLRLEPLTREESEKYLAHQVQAAGGNAERLFSGEAIDLLCQASKGIPRLLNQIADQSLRVAWEASAAGVDAEATIEAIEALGLKIPAGSSEPGLGSLAAGERAAASILAPKRVMRGSNRRPA
jgi:general secretion pathway protein A